MKRTWQNNLFAIREIGKASPLYLAVYLGATVVYGLLEFFTGTYLLRKIVNAVEAGQELSGLVTYVAVFMAISVVSYLALNWFWNVISPKIQEKIAMQIQKKILWGFQHFQEIFQRKKMLSLQKIIFQKKN